MKSRFLDYDVESVCRAVAQEASQAGWETNLDQLPDGFAAGPTIYLVHYEAQYLFLVHLVIGGVEKVQEVSNRAGITFQDACDALGTLMDELASRTRPLDKTMRNLLSVSAAHYLGGTQTYELGRERDADQYVVIRHFDAGNHGHILRPAACGGSGRMSPEDVSEFVLNVLNVDRKMHPTRFRKGQPLRFNPKPLA